MAQEIQEEAEIVTELFYLQSEADNLRLELAKMQEKIQQLESAWDPLLLERPSAKNTVARNAWISAGLGDSAELEEVVLALENWIFTQPNYDDLTADGWLTYLYDIIEIPFKKACNARHYPKLILEVSNEPSKDAR